MYPTYCGWDGIGGSEAGMAYRGLNERFDMSSMRSGSTSSSPFWKMRSRAFWYSTSRVARSVSGSTCSVAGVVVEVVVVQEGDLS